MRYLAHQRPPIAHGDLKGANVLIQPNGHACICDFGLSRFIQGPPMSVISSGCGTYRWMAPEQLIAETMIVSLQADIYAWGMLALELMTGLVPWSEIKQDCAVVKKVMDGLRPGRPKCQQRSQCRGQPRCICLIGNDALWELIGQCWQPDPGQRPNIEELHTALLALSSARLQTVIDSPEGPVARMKLPFIPLLSCVCLFLVLLCYRYFARGTILLVCFAYASLLG